jgi:hypothetical protein
VGQCPLNHTLQRQRDAPAAVQPYPFTLRCQYSGTHLTLLKRSTITERCRPATSVRSSHPRYRTIYYHLVGGRPALCHVWYEVVAARHAVLIYNLAHRPRRFFAMLLASLRLAHQSATAEDFSSRLCLLFEPLEDRDERLLCVYE